MTEQEFLDKVKEVDACLYTKTKNKDNYSTISYKNNRDSIELTDYLRVTWVSGGVGGGSCWDDGKSDSHYTKSSEPEPDFKSLEDLLATICPNISFLAFKKLLRDANIETGEETEYEYYGNSTTYRYKQVQLGNLYKALKETGLM